MNYEGVILSKVYAELNRGNYAKSKLYYSRVIVIELKKVASLI